MQKRWCIVWLLKRRICCACIAGALSVTSALAIEPQTAPTDVGPDPTLCAPTHSIIPTVHIAKATGWHKGQQPIAIAGLSVTEFASELDHPRWLYVLPNGDVLVAETNAPERPEDGKGIKGWFMKKFMTRAGATPPSANRITLLRDADHDGHAETRSVFLSNLNSPFGMALIDETFYVANTDALLSFPYVANATHLQGAGTKLIDLPAGPINHHWTKNIIASRDGSQLFITIGSNSNVAENGLAAEHDRAAILQFDLRTHELKPYATGLRNANGMGWESATGALWTTVNERDELGDSLVPDYLTSVVENGFYGWPYSYYGQHIDTRVKPTNVELVNEAIKPDYALGSHVAALGMCFIDASNPQGLAAKFGYGVFVSEHGSWNRQPFSGYKVVFIPFTRGHPAGLPQDVLTGFINEAGEAQGRPVGVVIDKQGALLVADDVGNRIWRIAPATQ